MAENNSRIFVSAGDRIRARENNFVDLILADGREILDLEPRRLFPVSAPDDYVTLLGRDGREAAVIRHVRELDDASRRVVEDSLNDYYLVPTITAILSAADRYGTLHWKVDTNRGIKEFDIRNRNHDIRAYGDGCVRVRDSDDNRYVIEDYRKLDRRSQSFLIVDL